MNYELAKTEDLQNVYNVVQHTIRTIYPKYYLTEVVDFFSELYSREAIAKDIENGHVSVFKIDENIAATGSFIGAGGVSFYQVMPTYHNPTGKKAYIMNMYTALEYRRQGIATHTLDLLVKDARDLGVVQITLEAIYRADSYGRI